MNTNDAGRDKKNRIVYHFVFSSNDKISATLQCPYIFYQQQFQNIGKFATGKSVTKAAENLEKIITELV